MVALNVEIVFLHYAWTASVPLILLRLSTCRYYSSNHHTHEIVIIPTFLCLKALLPTRFLKSQSLFLWWTFECTLKDEYWSDFWCNFLYFCEIFFAECVTIAGLRSMPSCCGNVALNLASTSLSMWLRWRSWVASAQLYERDSTTFSVVRTCWRAFWAETERYM